MTISDELAWNEKDIRAIQLELDNDAAFLAQANLDKKTIILNPNSLKKCKERIQWDLYTNEEIFAYMRDRLNFLVLVVTNQKKTTGDIGDIEKLNTDTKTLIRILKSYENPIHKKDFILNLIIDTGTYCADGVRKGIKNAIDNCVPLSSETSSIQQILDRALSAYRDAQLDALARTCLRFLSRAENDIHNVQLIRGVIEQWFWHNSQPNADQLPEVYNSLINIITRHRGSKWLWNHYSPAIILTIFKNLIREGEIKKEYIVNFPERLMHSEAICTVPQTLIATPNLN